MTDPPHQSALDLLRVTGLPVEMDIDNTIIPCGSDDCDRASTTVTFTATFSLACTATYFTLPPSITTFPP